MRFNDLPITHQLGWVKNAELIYKNMTPGKLLKLLRAHNPSVIRYGDAGQHSSWANDDARKVFMFNAKLELMS